jgi:HTH-type transcriptional regulator/antitoxin HigA
MVLYQPNESVGFLVGGAMAILNQRDYRQAKARVAQLEAACTSGGIIATTKNLSFDIAEAHRATLRSELERLGAEIAEYERLRGSPLATETIQAADLGLIPIIARITRDMSQKQLAELLAIKEQQVQRYESERYASISLSRFEKIIEALGVQFDARLNSRVSPKTDDRGQLIFSQALLNEILRRQWTEADVEEPQSALRMYVAEGERLGRGGALHRRRMDEGSNFDVAAMAAWQARVLRLGQARSADCKVSFNVADLSWLQDLTAISTRSDGPREAVSFLEQRGIIVVVEPHLAQTYLDGAAMVLTSGVPVVGLTLRYDRIDAFWFTLLHEIGHIFLHLNKGLSEGFIDNWDNFDDSNIVEREANAFARSALIPDELWKFAPVRFSRSAESIQNFAESHAIHPAIVAGRIRQERGDYTKFGKLLGQGQVRKLFQ